MELVSVIVPVYKVEKYLRECVDSILASTYTNLEIILVDDGSPDGCPQICDDYAQRDSRIRVIHQENRGLCAARNAGLGVATGTYVAFVDSDDFVSPFLYEKLVETIEAEGADWAACEYTRKANGLVVDVRDTMGTVHTLETPAQQLGVLVCAPQIRDITWTNSYVWDKLYRKERITRPFLVGCLNIEDMQFNWDYIQNSRKMAILSSALYFYRVNEESITETFRKNQTDRTAERGRSISETYRRITDQVPTEDPDLKRYMISRTVNFMHGALYRIHSNGLTKQNQEFLAQAGAYIRRYWRTVWQEKETYNLRAKLPVALFKFGYPLWVLVTKLIKI